MSHRFAVVGAGNGGQSFSAHLASLGYDVRLFDVDRERVDELRRCPSIELSGALAGSGTPSIITTDLGEAIEGADVILVAVPACYHESLAERIAPSLKPGQSLVLNPGATGGAMAVRQVLRRHGASNGVSISETETLLYACRAETVGKVHIFAVKDEVRLSSLPATETDEVLTKLRTPFPSFVGAPSVLHTSLGNLNAIAHPAPTLLNLGRIQSGQSFEFYREGMTPSITSVVERLDAERRAVARALGIAVPTLLESLRRFYGVEAPDLHEAFRTNTVYEGVLAPSSVDNRYLFEDVPTGLVPLAALGRATSVETPLMNAATDLACAVSARNYWQEGRTLARLGLEGFGVEAIRLAAQ